MEKEGKGYNDTYIVPVLTDETALSYACVISSLPNTYPRYRSAH